MSLHFSTCILFIFVGFLGGLFLMCVWFWLVVVVVVLGPHSDVQGLLLALTQKLLTSGGVQRTIWNICMEPESATHKASVLSMVLLI